MLAVVKSIEPAECDYGSDEFEDIDDLENFKPANSKKVQKQEVFVPSIQMKNGKWTCSHPCADGQVLKNGKQCKHRCCHEGLDRPRKMKKGSDNVIGSGSGSQGMNSNSGATQKSKVSGPWLTCVFNLT
jgi:ATP-dependent DNA helicase HFM1/MER3